MTSSGPGGRPTPVRGDPAIVLLALGLSLGPTVSNSFARFAYSLVLPAMREDLGLSFSAAGFLNTANALGYLLGAILTRGLIRHWGNRILFNRGMLLTALALLLTGLASELYMLALCRILGGIGAAAAFICGGALASNIAAHDPRWPTRCITIYFGGAGFGLMLSGLLIPWWMAASGPSGWPHTWVAMGGASLLMVLASRAASQRIEEPAHAQGRPDWLLRPLLPAFLAYIGFGLGYIVYMTFIIAWLKALGASATDSAVVWILLGLTTLLAPLVWSRPLARWSCGHAMAAILAVLGLGALLPVVPVSAAWQGLTMQCSAALFGLGMFSVPSAISALIRQSLDKPAWGAAMATFTIAFAASQVLAPVLGGWIADWSGSLREGIAISAAVILGAALVALLQKAPPPPAARAQG